MNWKILFYSKNILIFSKERFVELFFMSQELHDIKEPHARVDLYRERIIFATSMHAQRHEFD